MIRHAALAVLLLAAPALAAPEAVLPPELPWSGQSRSLIAPAGDRWITPAEASGLTATPRYDETVAWLRALVAAAPQLALLSLGRSAEGREIWMVVASQEGASTPAALRANGRPTLLAHAGIHAGEIDGKDAGLMLLRDMTVRGTRGALLDGANFLFVPILSVDGHERFSRHSRINQRGPVEMGWRTNRRNLNLNRDFTKLESEELRALVPAILAWRPDLYIDLHVTDGADYQYDITFGYNGAFAWSPGIAGWLDERFAPRVRRDLEALGHVPGPLIFGANGRDMSDGQLVWTASPRFSNGWGDARHLPTVLVENHSLKPYEQRVLGTYVLLESALRVLAESGDALRAATRADRTRHAAEVPLGWQVDRDATPRQLPFKGVRAELYPSAVSGSVHVRWTGEPIDQEIPFLVMSRPTRVARRPAHYYIPAAWYPIAEMLRRQGIEVERLEQARTIEAEIDRLPHAELNAAASPFEGRTLYTPGAIDRRRETVRLPAGSFRVPTAQPLGTLAVLLLEPECPDSLFQWGYFAAILQRTEYFEGYVMEPLAQALLDADPELRREFERKLLDDAEFAGSARARLEWFYRRTPYHDAEHRRYPVVRSVD